MTKVAKVIGVCVLIFTGLAIFSFYQNSLPPAEFKNYKGLDGVSSNDVLSVKMERMAEEAAMDAWNRYHVRVHIDAGSLPEFERYLNLVSKSSWFQNESEKDRWAEGVIDGAFVGEAIRRTHGGFWAEKSQSLPEAGSFVLNVEGSESWPVNWCIKRLKNGPEDNICDKYKLYILHRTNGFSGDITYWSNHNGEFQQITNVTIK